MRALHREHHVTQGAIAAPLRRHKSWGCRRLMLVEALDSSVEADVRLGLLRRGSDLVGALPRGNEPAVSGRHPSRADRAADGPLVRES